MHQIRSYFQSLVDISEKDWQLFSSRLVERSFTKKTIILKAGQVEKHLSFIESGIIRYYFQREIDDITFEFGFENEFASAYDSFIHQVPSSYQVEALTDVKLWQLSFHDLQEIYQFSDIGNTIGRLAAENLYLKKSVREKSLLLENAEERYLKLFRERPELIRQIPLKYIASYIGITPQALSRIRRNIS